MYDLLDNISHYLIPLYLIVSMFLCVDNVPSCLCDDGWEGIICAASIDDCINNNCPADAECVDGHLTYTCK